MATTPRDRTQARGRHHLLPEDPEMAAIIADEMAKSTYSYRTTESWKDYLKKRMARHK